MNDVDSVTNAEPSGDAARWNTSHAVTSFLNSLATSSPNARMAMALGELATSCDAMADGQPFCVGISGVESGAKAAMAACGLAGLWGRWGLRSCLIDLASGQGSLQGALTRTSIDLQSACNGSSASGSLTDLSGLHSSIGGATVIAAGGADVLGLISTGRLTGLVQTLKKNHDRVVLCAPHLQTGFPFTSLHSCCDCLVLALVRGRTRGGPVRELAEQSLRSGQPPIDAIWFD